MNGLNKDIFFSVSTPVVHRMDQRVVDRPSSIVVPSRYLSLSIAHFPLDQNFVMASPLPSLSSSTDTTERVPIVRREDALLLLRQTEFANPNDDGFWCGRIFAAPPPRRRSARRGPSHGLPKPTVVWKSDAKPRDDHDAPEWLTASEYEDKGVARNMKVSQLAALLRMSKKTVVYSGAGISRAAGIGQAARGGSSGGGGVNRTTTANPTFTHYALAKLAGAGLVHGWVQQNHDGLPQKAGFPQERINEVHGSWYDPSNPVVLYSGNLKQHECEWMEQDANTADLALVLGTSLGGLNADRVATDTADRSLRGRSLGMVLINLQQTALDGESTLRLFGKTDDVLGSLLAELGVAAPLERPFVFTGSRRVVVPYDEDGNRSSTVRMWWDLSVGAKIKLNKNHNIQGAKQPIYMHIGAKRAKTIDGVRYEPGYGHGVVKRWSNQKVGIDLHVDRVHMLLGQWWLDAAIRGGPLTIPVINPEPVLVQGETKTKRRTRK